MPRAGPRMIQLESSLGPGEEHRASLSDRVAPSQPTCRVITAWLRLAVFGPHWQAASGREASARGSLRLLAGGLRPRESHVESPPSLIMMSLGASPRAPAGGHSLSA
eukprot:982518-Rhodomonas_salina.1